MTNDSSHNNQVPIATTAALMQKTRDARAHKRHTATPKKKTLSSYKSTFSHNPMVMAMITNNRLTSCQDVTKMMQECRKNGAAETDQVCLSAARYMESCLRP